ncbi:zinc-dependent metalloprotease [Pedobacter sp. N36a]|uniref:zinc-dependent metalloprotease n=1 Tax=Pedobacter sp. N36a TaxID=2767996 RepID=UPI001656E4E2|nr:zinc-dependent metalloprotease [Pedobacter sp. N36a]MBC8985164.1 zinc-dependent metalloprotease [Pedobacter sp. N36a]
MKQLSLITLVLLGAGVQGFSQQKNPKKGPVVPPGNPNPVNRPVTTGPKPYADVITAKAKTDKGLFKVHTIEDRYFFEIPDSLLDRDILVVNRISKAAAGNRSQMMGYGGDQIGDNVISFQKGPANKLFLKSISYTERSQDTTAQGLYKSVMNSNLQPLVASFDIKALAKDSVSGAKGVVIDVTEYMNGDNEIFFFDPSVKKALNLTGVMPDRSYIKEIKAYPMNIEIRTLKTYMKTGASFPGMSGPPSATPATYELNSSMVLLPESQMKARYFDPRVGYFATGYVDFDANPQGVKNLSLITRWRLEPKTEDIEKYQKGELVEPKKQIIFYIDPATPKKWVPYLMQGVNDWQAAFEKAGFKNAIVAKEAPSDPSWSIEDARHNVIVYKPSDIPNASGPHVHDPRTGEILETHVNWYHNVMLILRNWYLIQAGAVDPQARKMKFDDKLMGELIRFVSSHEIGHTLGLRHNFGSSATVPVENLRNKQWVEKNGHTPSIMDYARFNYVAQPEDNISSKGIFPRIGDYDLWAIEWGYKWKPEFKGPQEELSASNKEIINRLTNNKRLVFGTESDANDPRNQNEDLGDNAMLASAYGIKNLKRILPNLLTWTKEPNEDYQNARMFYAEVISQFGRYMGHVTKNVGGIYTTPKKVEQAGAVYVAVPYATQKEAMTFLNTQLFNSPTWLINKELIERTGYNAVDVFQGVQKSTLSRLISAATIGKLINAEVMSGAKAYTADNLFADLKSGIWSELYSHKPIDVYRRNLQKAYVDNLSKLMVVPSANPSGGGFPGMRTMDPTSSDVSSIARAHMAALAKDIRAAIPTATGLSKYHLQDLLVRVNNVLNPKS